MRHCSRSALTIVRAGRELRERSFEARVFALALPAQCIELLLHLRLPLRIGFILNISLQSSLARTLLNRDACRWGSIVGFRSRAASELQLDALIVYAHTCQRNGLIATDRNSKLLDASAVIRVINR